MAVVPGGSKMNLVEGYAAGEDSQVDYGRHRYLAQTFTLDDDYTVWRFRLKDWTICGGEFYHYAIRNTDAAGKPVGEDIYHTTLSPTGEYWYSPGKWTRFDFDEFPKLPAGTYAIVASVPDATSWECYKLSCDASASEYAGGKAWLSHNDGIDWEEIPETDLMFEVWGYQPPPEAPPPPVISNWAPLKLELTYIEDGYELVVTTDIPVHLFMRWSTTEPLKHPMSELRRGLIKLTGTRYCFVAWKENEQIEPGDTYVHTFIKTNWPVCQTRWFYFIGTKQAEEQPSSSAIFYKHRVAPPPVPEEKILIGSVDNRTMRSNDTLWAACWGGSRRYIGPWHDAPTYALHAAAERSVTYWIHRSWLYFPPLNLPPGASIVSAQMQFFFFWKEITSSEAFPYIYLQRSFWGPPVYLGMWGFQNSETEPLGQIHIGHITLDQYNDVELNQDGLDFLENDVANRFCIRTEMDVKNLEAALGINGVSYHSEQKGASFRPLLKIQYYPP